MPCWGTSWSWLYGSWIYNYSCNQCLSPQTLWVWTPTRRGVPFSIQSCRSCYMLCSVAGTTTLDRENGGVLDTGGKACEWLATGRWFTPGTPVSSTNKTDHHDLTAILLKVAISTTTSTNKLNAWQRTNIDHPWCIISIDKLHTSILSTLFNTTILNHL